MDAMGEAVSTAPSRGRAAGLRFATDERLARRAAQGDGAAFAAIFRRYQRDLSRYCQAILGSREQAEDALQNTMVSAMKALPGETREISLKPWLYRVAHNESISLMRQRRPLEEIDPELPAQDADPGPRAEAREGLATLLGDLETLPDRQRGALIMRELADFDYADIAASFDFSEGAARQAIYEARKALLEMAEGREMTCAAIRAEMSENDRRVLRGRRLRAHLRGCAGCREFEAAIKQRREEFAQIAPLAPAVSAAILQSVLGSSAAGTGGGLGSIGGAGGILGGAGAVKSAAAVVAVAAAGVGAADLAGVVDLGGKGSQPTSASEAPPGAASEAGTRGMPDAKGTDHTGAGRGAAGGQSAGEGQGAKPATSGAGNGKGNANGHGKGQGKPGNGNAYGQGNANAVGQGGTPPGQAQTPPGQSGSASSTPMGPPPGQAMTPPGQGGTPPGQAGTSPGTAGTAPGVSGTSPPQAGTAGTQGQRPADAGPPERLLP
jgi:RNA polymerase sigma factor (sigma-70 family)